MSILQSQLAANLTRIHERMAQAAEQAGREASEIKLVGVTKYVNAEFTRMLAASGCVDLGEARPQALWEKAEALADLPIRWNMIGHLQRNKIRRTLPHVSLLHSGDSLQLLREVHNVATQLGRAIDTLLEVNISGDANKHGFQPAELLAALPELATLSHIRVRGLMTMAALEGGPERARRDFANLREFRDQVRRECPPNIELAELSMGMSGDFEEAILEGATLIRVGSALWEGIATS